jgi:hypothetical protein
VQLRSVFQPSRNLYELILTIDLSSIEKVNAEVPGLLDAVIG